MGFISHEVNDTRQDASNLAELQRRNPLGSLCHLTIGDCQMTTGMIQDLVDKCPRLEKVRYFPPPTRERWQRVENVAVQELIVAKFPAGCRGFDRRRGTRAAWEQDMANSDLY